MISIEGRLPLTLNKSQLIKFAEAEVRRMPAAGYDSKFLKVLPVISAFQLKDISLETNYEQLSGIAEAVLPFKIILPFCSYQVTARPKLKFGVGGIDISPDKMIGSLNVDFSSLELSGIWSVFGNTIRRNIGVRLQKLVPEVTREVNSEIQALLAKKFKLDFDLGGLKYANLLTIKSLALRECCSDINSVHLDVNACIYIENTNRNYSSEFTDIDRKEYPEQFHIAIHQDFIHSIASQLIKDFEVPVLNKKIPLALESFKIENNIIHAGVAVTELYKGAWNLQIDTRIDHDVLKFSVRQIHSLTGGSILDRGITKLLELGIEKLLGRFAEVPLSLINKAVADVLKDSYHIPLKDLILKLSVPKVKVTNIELPDNNALLTCHWEDSFYIDL